MSYLSDEQINTRLKEDYDFVKSMGYDIFGVFLFGSQNYGADYENSDIDTRVIVFPKFTEIVNGSAPISTTKFRDNGEHIDIKDFRVFVDQLLKPSLVYLETLCTKHCIVNPSYEDIYNSMFDLCDDLADQNKLKVLLDIWGRKNSHVHHLEVGNKNRIEQYGYDYKQVYQLIRLAEFINRFSLGESFTSCLLYSNPNYLIEFKRNPPERNEALCSANSAASEIDSVYRANFDKLKLAKGDSTANKLLDILRIKAMKRYLYEVIV